MLNEPLSVEPFDFREIQRALDLRNFNRHLYQAVMRTADIIDGEGAGQGLHLINILSQNGIFSPFVVLGFNIDTISPSCGETPLALACKLHSPNLAEIFLLSGANPDAKSAKEALPLQIATALGDLDTINLLLAYGANINKKGYGGLSALGLVVLKNDLPIAEKLLMNGADIAVYSNDGRNPIMQAFFSDNKEMMKLLLQAKPQKTEVDFIEYMNEDILKRLDQETVKLLKDYCDKCPGKKRTATEIASYIESKSQEQSPENKIDFFKKYEYSIGFGIGVFFVNPTIEMTRDWMNNENKDKTVVEYYLEVFNLNSIKNVAVSVGISIATKTLCYYAHIPEDNYFGISKIVPEFESQILNGIMHSTAYNFAMLAGDTLSTAYCGVFSCDS